MSGITGEGAGGTKPQPPQGQLPPITVDDGTRGSPNLAWLLDLCQDCLPTAYNYCSPPQALLQDLVLLWNQHGEGGSPEGQDRLRAAFKDALHGHARSIKYVWAVLEKAGLNRGKEPGNGHGRRPGGLEPAAPTARLVYNRLTGKGRTLTAGEAPGPDEEAV